MLSNNFISLYNCFVIIFVIIVLPIIFFTMLKNKLIDNKYNNLLINTNLSYFLLKTTSLIFLGFFLLNLTGCYSDPYLYDRAGFEPGTTPSQDPGMSGSQNRVAPDYYYRQPQGYNNQGGQPYPSQNYQYQNQYQQPQYGSPYQVYPAPGSRYYSNPYAIPASPYYPQYDADQYYVPPAYYGVENQQNSMQKPQSIGRSY
jgi:hypothetical protein